MITTNEARLSMVNSPVRKIRAKVELWTSSSAPSYWDVWYDNGPLVDFKIERTSEEGKFFGFGMCQHTSVTVRDVDNQINYVNKDCLMKMYYLDESGADAVKTTPTFYVSQTRRDENTNALTVYGYDLIYPSARLTVNELNLGTSYTIRQFAEACAALLGTELVIVGVGTDETCFDTEFTEGANFDGSESVRVAMDAIAEATQTIYYVNSEDKLVFRRLAINEDEDIEISKDKYFTLKTEDGRRLNAICSASELGNNVTATVPNLTGSTQYVRDNPFWDLREDIATLLDNAIAAVGGMSIRQFECEWRGNFFVEPGDKLALITKEGNKVYSYLLDDTVEYDGTYRQSTKWKYDDNEEESESNPTSLGDVLNKTYARVDKVNQQVEIAISNSTEAQNQVANLKLDLDSVSASVTKTEQKLNQEIETVNGNISTLTSKVEATMTAEDVQLQINTTLKDGVTEVTTTTGFTFNEEGMRVSKSGSEMETVITEDGMTVFKDDEAVLTANNKGVVAIDLHAQTYLIIGKNSRLEDYGGNRTGMFWIGG